MTKQMRIRIYQGWNGYQSLLIHDSTHDIDKVSKIWHQFSKPAYHEPLYYEIEIYEKRDYELDQ